MLQELYHENKKQITKYVKNGLYLPFVKILLYFGTGDLFLSTIIIQKAYVANYYYHFEHLYHYVPHPHNWIKQFVRYTDTGHIASFLYYFYPEFVGISHNVHFTITAGYWFGRLVLNLQDQDSKKDDEIIDWFSNMWTCGNHGLAYSMILYRMIYLPLDSYDESFTTSDLYYSYVWLYSWFIFIYIPWRVITGDSVYSVVAYDSPITHKIIIFITMNGLIYLGNSFGYFVINQ